jgi:predicted secreted Zn-dependent protease
VPLETIESIPRPGLHLTSRTVTYAVRGRTIHQLRDEMARIGPIDDGRHQFAYTWGMYAWKYPHQETPEGCRTGKVSTELEIVQTFPEWIGRQGADAITAREWDRWLSATKAHEEGHRKIALATGERIVEQLESLGPQATCGDADRAANELGNKLLKDMRAEHSGYDRDTQHGRTTGAFLGEEVP